MTMKQVNKKFRTLYLFVNSVIIFILHIPFVFAKSSADKIKSDPGSDESKVVATANTSSTSNNLSANSLFRYFTVFDSLHLNLNGLSKNIFEMAVKGLDKIKQSGVTISDNIISIVDFSQPSFNKRLYVIDLNNYSLLFNTYVAHGQNSGEAFAEHFSNRPQSLQSSPGFYITMDTYSGSNGYSLKLNGLEYGINNNALKRDIVVHGAPYVSEKLINEQGYIGRSWGCPAVPLSVHRQLIETIKNGTCLFIYTGQASYLERSVIIK